jgi:hypothetical protein
MRAPETPLYYICAIAGFIMVAGGIWLIYREKIYIDRETKEVIEVKTPIGTFKTNIPALMLFVLGFVPLIYPIYSFRSRSDSVEVHGYIDGDSSSPLELWAATHIDSVNPPHDFRATVMLPSSAEVRVFFASGNTIVNRENPSHGNVDFGHFVIPRSAPSAGPDPSKNVYPLSELQTPPGFNKIGRP